MTEGSQGAKESEPEISVVVPWREGQMVKARGKGLPKSGVELKGMMPVQMSNYTVSGTGLADLAGFRCWCMTMCPRLSDETLLPCLWGRM